MYVKSTEKSNVNNLLRDCLLVIMSTKSVYLLCFKFIFGFFFIFFCSKTINKNPRIKTELHFWWVEVDERVQ